MTLEPTIAMIINQTTTLVIFENLLGLLLLINFQTPF